MEAKRLEDLNAAASAEGADDETKARYVQTRTRDQKAFVVCFAVCFFFWSRSCASRDVRAYEPSLYT